MTEKECQAIFDSILMITKNEFDRRIAPLSNRIEALEARPAALKYAGVWQPTVYECDAAVTHDGGLWIARRDTKPTEKPGDESLAFQLAVRRGRDGRDR